MADNYSLTILAEISQANIGDFTLTPPIQQGTPHYQATELVLANGDNTITVPTFAAWTIIIFDPTSSTTKKFKGVGGDTGITVGQTSIAVFAVNGGTTFIINSSAVDTLKTTRIVFF